MKFGILGPLRVGDGDGEPAVTAARDRIVLGMLLLNRGRVVGLDELVDAVWEDSPPATARAQLQTCVSRLRRILPEDTLVTDPAGYSIRVGDDDVDASVFVRLVAKAREVAGDRPDEARPLFRSALNLWRGPAAAGIDSRAVRRSAAVLDEQQAVAVEDWVDLEISGGRERDLIGELAGLVERYPLRERLRAQLMLALYRAGRQADALAEYRRIRVLLREERGIEPGSQLQDLHRRILTGEAVSAPAPALTRGPAPVRSLPRAVGDFTGRAGLVDSLRSAVEQASGGPVVLVIDGMAGIGKTTLAVHLAGLVGDRYPDAHLFVDLHAHSGRVPVEPAAALVTLLRRLGIEPENIPSDPDERTAMWRRELAARRALVVLDDAATSAQVTPLLPGSDGCLVLVTSRRRLKGLDGVRPQSLPVLSGPEAVELLARIGGDRVAAEPEAAAEVVRRCGHLPLAIRLAGARLAHRPRWRVSDLARRLGEAALPGLAAEDRTVARAFTLSYRQLDQPARRLFRRLGVHPGGRFGVPAVAALADLPLADAEDLLDALVDVHLVDEPEAGSYRLHDLLREFAAVLARDDDPAGNTAAVIDLLDLQLHTFALAYSGAVRDRLAADLKLAAPRRPDLVAAVGDPVSHLERERSDLVALVDAAVAVDRPQYAWLLARAVWRHLWSRGYVDDVEVLQQRALHAARAASDDAAVALCSLYLASAYLRFARYEEACALVEDCIAVRVRIGDTQGVANATSNLAMLYEAMGRLAECAQLLEAAIRTSRKFGDADRVRQYLMWLGCVEGWLGRPVDGLRHLRLALMNAVDERDERIVGLALAFLGQLRNRSELGDAAMVRRLLDAALRLIRRHGGPKDEAEVRNEQAVLLRREGRYPEAVEAHQAAIAIAVRLGLRRYEAFFVNDLADTVAGTGDRVGALALHRRALSLADEIRHPQEQALAHAGIAACIVEDDPAAARRHWERAVALFTEIGMPQTPEVRRRLAAVAGHPA